MMNKKELEKIAVLEVALECNKFTQLLMELEEGFNNGIYGREVLGILEKCADSIAEITKKSNGIIEGTCKITGEKESMELDIINPLLIMGLAIGIRAFVSELPTVTNECDEDGVTDFINEFFENMFEILSEIYAQLEEKAINEI